MILRILAAVAFLFGGVLTWIILGALKAFGASQAAMSAGAAHGAPDRDRFFMLFLCSYFLIGAFAAVFCTRRRAFWFSASLAYLVLLLTFVGMCFQNGADQIDRILAGALTAGLIGLFYFIPWTFLWFLVFLKCEKNTLGFEHESASHNSG